MNDVWGGFGNISEYGAQLCSLENGNVSTIKCWTVRLFFSPYLIFLMEIRRGGTVAVKNFRTYQSHFLVIFMQALRDVCYKLIVSERGEKERSEKDDFLLAQQQQA